MNYDTAGRPIFELPICDCGLTGGCERCRPSFIGMLSAKEAKVAKKKLIKFKFRFDKDLNKRLSGECMKYGILGLIEAKLKAYLKEKK